MTQALAAVAVALCSLPASAQWTVTALQPTTYYFNESKGVSVHNGQVVGWIVVNGQRQARIWRNGTPETSESLGSSPGVSSAAACTSGDQHVGYITLVSGYVHPVRWSGTPASLVDLLPANASLGAAYSTWNGQQVGHVVTQGVDSASLWSGTPASWVNLHPAGSTGSSANGIHHGQQAGAATFAGVTRACLWRGSAASRVDLHPPGAVFSAANDVHSGVQVGRADFGDNNTRPILWRGTAASWVDLSPPNSRDGYAYAAWGGRQVGSANFSFGRRPIIWRGTAASAEILPTLSLNYVGDEAYDIWADANRIMVCGVGYNRAAGAYQALLWTRPNCVADQDDGSGLGNPDEGVSIDDLLYMLTAYAAGNIRADVDNGSGTGVPDGGVTIEDLLYFLARYAAGC